MPYDAGERKELVDIERSIQVLKAKMECLLPAFQKKCNHEIVVQGEQDLIVNTATRICTICKIEEHGYFDERGVARGYKLLADNPSREVFVVHREKITKYRVLRSLSVADLNADAPEKMLNIAA